MRHRHHLVWVSAAIGGLAVWFLVAGDGRLALAGVSLALLICPLVVGVMWLLMRQPQPSQHQSATVSHDDPAKAGRR